MTSANARQRRTNRAGLSAARPSDDQELRALERLARADVALPAAAFVIDEAVTALEITYGGHPRAGLTLVCERKQQRFGVNLADVVFPDGSDGARFVAAYRAWLAGGELPSQRKAGSGDGVQSDSAGVGQPLELVVLACKTNALRCRVLASGQEVTLRTAVRDEVPGAIVSVLPTRQWTHAQHAYLAGSVVSMRADVEALGLTPLALREEGEWDPDDEYWGEHGEPVDDWAKAIIARGKRPMFEMEQVIPGADPDDFDSDPILEASELNRVGDRGGAREILMSLLARDLRCLDAHAHLGNFVFERAPAEARRHYETGLGIGALSLGKEFDGVLAWGLVDNRPYLRCLHGVGLCAWHLGDLRAAATVFRRMLWLNPGDNQGARFNLAAVEAGRIWHEMEDGER